jgi:hypothetical protein
MANLLYLAAAIVMAIVVSTFIVVRNRKPTSMEAGIDAFNRELRALAPDKRGAAPAPRGRAVVEPRGSRVIPRVDEINEVNEVNEVNENDQSDESTGATSG